MRNLLNIEGVKLDRMVCDRETADGRTIILMCSSSDRCLILSLRMPIGRGRINECAIDRSRGPVKREVIRFD